MSQIVKISMRFDLVIPDRLSPRGRKAFRRLGEQARVLEYLKGFLDGGGEIDLDEHHVADMAEAFKSMASILRRAKATTPGAA